MAAIGGFSPECLSFFLTKAHLAENIQEQASPARPSSLQELFQMYRTAAIMRPLPVRSFDAAPNFTQPGCSLPPNTSRHRMQPFASGSAQALTSADLIDARRA